MEDRYIGDGVYASWDGYQIWLRAEFNRIALDAGTFESLLRYARDLRELNMKHAGLEADDAKEQG